MTNYDYTSVRSLGNPTKAFPKIQSMEQEGWELVSIVPFTVIATVGYTIIMRRLETKT